VEALALIHERVARRVKDREGLGGAVGEGGLEVDRVAE
jgi:hypothetical protein